jgi:hypothetical protein
LGCNSQQPWWLISPLPPSLLVERPQEALLCRPLDWAEVTQSLSKAKLIKLLVQ